MYASEKGLVCYYKKENNGNKKLCKIPFLK